MSDAGHVTQILNAIGQGDSKAADELLPLVYAQLRQLAQRRMLRESPGQTLEATALVHEAYLRLVDGQHQQRWDSRGHFYAAAAEAMRRILVETARRKGSQKRGGNLQRMPLEDSHVAAPENPEEILALDESLERLGQIDPQAAQLVKLRYFSGLTVPQAAEVLGLSTRTAERLFTYARAWLYRDLEK